LGQAAPSPDRLSKRAALLVTIGIDPARIDHQASLALEQWNDIPDSSAYSLMHQSLLEHVVQVLRAAPTSSQ
jgi:hypothetical protein